MNHSELIREYKIVAEAYKAYNCPIVISQKIEVDFPGIANALSKCEKEDILNSIEFK